MEPKFQTSFIPKKPSSGGVPTGMTRPSSSGRGTSFFMIIGVIAFLISLGGVGGAYAWRQYLTNQQSQYKKDLADREQQFNIDLIQQLKLENVKIDLAKQLLANHIAMSQVFAVIQKLTIQSVRFLSFDVTSPKTKGDKVTLSLNGYGKSLAAVAFQSDVLSHLEQYGLRNVVKNPILSNPSLDAQGTVSFGFTGSLDPSYLSYTKSLSPDTSSANSNSSTDNSGTDLASSTNQ